MNRRTKIWLMTAAVSLAVLSSGVRLHVTRAGVIKEARISAEEVAHDIAEELKADLTSGEEAADNRVLEEKMLGYINRHSRIVQLGFYPVRPPSSPSSRIGATRDGEALESTRFAPAAVELTKNSIERARPAAIEVPVETAGSLKGRLVMKWTFGPIESLFVTEERVLLATSVVLLVALALLERRLLSSRG
jgi:hypothetical protein